ncbi:MAG: hypothetical protein ACRELD_01865 [Longimicrobiales bacterium]
MKGWDADIAWRSRRGAAVAALAALILLSPRPVEAQLTSECKRAADGLPGVIPAADRERVEQYCNLVALTVEATQPRLGLGLSGGNPVPGTGSTLGMRLGTLPRLSLALRATAVKTDIPDIRTETATGELTFPLGSIDADGALGLYSGFSVAPTVGGIGSVDLLASAGIIPVPSGEGFGDASPTTWAAGARVGLLRESFTLPGLSVSAMYRSLGEVTYGDSLLQQDDAYFHADLRQLSLRGVVSKDVLFFAFAAGAGWDRFTSDVAFGASSAGTFPGTNYIVRIPSTELQTDATVVFGNLALNFLVANLVAELGWQSGGDLESATLAPGRTVTGDDGTIFGSLALRLSF